MNQIYIYMYILIGCKELISVEFLNSALKKKSPFSPQDMTSRTLIITSKNIKNLAKFKKVLKEK